MIHVLRPQSVRRLRRELDRAVAMDPSLVSARAAVLQPLELLEALGAETPGALANDSEAQERMRLMLSIASASALRLERSAPHAPDGPDVAPCDLGLVDAGALVVVALAAGRVGKRAHAADRFVDTVLGTAMLAAPAEALSRALDSGLGTKQIVAVLGSLFAAPESALLAAAIEPLMLDACEVARWRCRQRLIRRVHDQVKETEWEGAVAAPILSVTGGDVGRVVIHLARPGDDVSPEAKAWLSTFKQGHGKVVFGAIGRSPIAAVGKVEDGAIVAEVPAAARAGWVGLTSKRLQDATRDGRDRVRAHWVAQNASSPCLRDTPVPVDAIGGRELDWMTPPRTPAASWGVRITSMTLEQDGSEDLRAGLTTRVVATVSPATLPVEGELAVGASTFPMESAPGSVFGEIPGDHVADEQDVTVRVSLKGSTRIDDERSLELSIPTPAEPPAPPPSVPGPSPSQPAPSGDGRRLPDRVVLLRPAFRDRDDRLIRASIDALAALVSYYEGRAAPLPWIADADLLFAGVPDDPDGSAVGTLVERVENLAARTSGYEDALWIALVPTPAHGRGLSRLVASEAALAIAVLSEDAVLSEGSSDRMPRLPTNLRAQVPLRRLRVIGRAVGDDVVLTEPARVEYRAAGPGAEFVTELLATTTDRAGRELHSRRVRTANGARSGHFVLQIPVTEDDAALQLRQQAELLAVELRAQPAFVDVDLHADRELGRERVTARASVSMPRRSRGRPLPSLTRPTAAPEFVGGQGPSLELVEDPATHAARYRVRWTARHPQGIRPRVEIELGQIGEVTAEVWSLAWMRVATGEGAVGELEVAVDRLIAISENDASQVDRIRVVLSDGWNTIIQETPLLRPGGDDGERSVPHQFVVRSLLVRRATRLRYWADTLVRGDVRWSVRDDKGNLIQSIDKPSGPWWVDVAPEHIGRILQATQGDDDADLVVDRVRITGDEP